MPHSSDIVRDRINPALPLRICEGDATDLRQDQRRRTEQVLRAPSAKAPGLPSSAEMSPARHGGRGQAGPSCGQAVVKTIHPLAARADLGSPADIEAGSSGWLQGPPGPGAPWIGAAAKPPTRSGFGPSPAGTVDREQPRRRRTRCQNHGRRTGHPGTAVNPSPGAAQGAEQEPRFRLRTPAKRVGQGVKALSANRSSGDGGSSVAGRGAECAEQGPRSRLRVFGEAGSEKRLGTSVRCARSGSVR